MECFVARADVLHAVREVVEGTALTQREIAQRVGISQERVSVWTRTDVRVAVL